MGVLLMVKLIVIYGIIGPMDDLKVLINFVVCFMSLSQKNCFSGF